MSVENIKSSLKETEQLPYRFAREKKVLIQKNGEKLEVKTTSSVSIETLSELRSYLKKPLEIIWLEPENFEKELSDTFTNTSTSSSELVEDIDDNYDLSALAENLPKTSDLLDSEDDAPVIQLINAILSEAIKSKASDIHIEPYEDYVSVRFRVDGILSEILRPSGRIAPMLNARIKVMSNLDIAEKRIPQDGRMSLKLGEKWVDIRVSTLPSSHGEKLVLRILDKAETQLRLQQLGMNSETLKKFESCLKTPNGIILVTGPTGSGKTTTLYAGLNILNDQTKNILTVEDPIEYAIEGVTQTQVNTKVGMTFAKGLRAILRQDPDTIMLGEIRDLETAEIAIQASLTGHLVLSTMHTNNSVAAITRMIDMGIESYLLASTLNAVLAQRLVRKLCSCKEDYLLDTTIDSLKTGTKLYKAVGCKNCNYSGYQGRIGIFELFLITEEIKEAINSGETENKLSEIAFSNQNRLSTSGYDLALEGVTSLDEILRVTSEK
tara:strand:- start:6364 stop:7845 length:1482 start_codon:yes stop_codon:yes gene_type:complete